MGNKNNFKHGLSMHPLYRLWKNIYHRCYNKNHCSYKNYGYRNIKVCEQWKNDFLEFWWWAISAGWGKPGLEIDRIDNDCDYCPQNCRFITHGENQKNRRIYGKIKVKYIHKHRNKYMVGKRINGKNKYYGTFVTLEEAKSVAKTI